MKHLKFVGLTILIVAINAFAAEGDVFVCGTEEPPEPQLNLPYSTGQYVSLNIWDRWEPEMQHRLSYCVTDRFKGDRAKIQRAMKTAASEWMQSANVTFYEVQTQGKCEPGADGVLFAVTTVHRRARYNMRAFFPSYEPERRWIRVNPKQRGSSESKVTGLFRHELGHVLGFRHEQVHPDAEIGEEREACAKTEKGLRPAPITGYDVTSVMHYPICGGTNAGYGYLSEYDKVGAAFLYPGRRENQ